MSDTNLTKKYRREMIDFLEKIKSEKSDDETLRMVNKIENALTEKKFGLVFEEHREEVDDLLQTNIPVLCEDAARRICKDENLPWNFIIEGDNLQALYLLLKTHRGKINLIYIDPPYNTGAHDWKYNNDYVDATDGYRHSKWLSMMKVRLELAKQLLTEDGVLICTIDEKEYLHLGCLLEEMFPEARIQMISDVINPKGVARSGFRRNDEYIFCVMLGNAVPCRLPLGEEWSASAIISSNTGDKKGTAKPGWTSMMRRGTNSSRSHSPGCYYPIFVNPETKIIEKIGTAIPQGHSRAEEIKGLTQVLPIRTNGDEGVWQVSPTELKTRLEQGRIKVGKETSYGFVINYLPDGAYKDLLSEDWTIDGYEADGSVIAHKNEDSADDDLRIPPTQWKTPSHNASENGSTLIARILKDKRFSFPKSLYAEYDTIRFFAADNPNAIILDFFAGSGTTMHAVNLMNAEDGGNRRCILVTNNEISEQEEKELTNKGFKKGDEEWEKLGIAKYVTWPRNACVINGVDIDGKPLEGDYGVEKDGYEIDEDSVVVSKTTGKPLKNKLYKKSKIQIYPELARIKQSDGFKTNVKYFKCDWTPRKPEEYFLSNVLMLHIKEMIELENSVEIDYRNNVLILNKDDYTKYIENDSVYKNIKNIWVNQKILFESSEIEKMKKKNFRYIPSEYFGQELKDVAE